MHEHSLKRSTQRLIVDHLRALDQWRGAAAAVGGSDLELRYHCTVVIALNVALLETRARGFQGRMYAPAGLEREQSLREHWARSGVRPS